MSGAQEAVYGAQEWLDFLGRLHPLVLHLPIGLFAGLVLLEIVDLVAEGSPLARKALAFAFGLSAAAAGTTGWLLADTEGLTGELVDLHRQLGIGVGVAAVLVAIVSQFGASRKWTMARWALIFVSGALITLAGHNGGMMSHGQRFLSDKAPPWLAPYVGPPARQVPRGAGQGTPQSATTEGSDSSGATDPAEVVPGPEPEPDLQALVVAFQSLCFECHSETKVKGGLRLDVLDGWAATVDRDDLEMSELLYRVTLPAGDPDVMPPEGELLDPRLVAVLEDWLRGGASEEELRSALEHP